MIKTEKRNWCLSLFWLGICFLVLAFLASLFFGNLSAKGVEQKLDDAVIASLKAQKVNWAKVDVSGQKVSMSGLAPSVLDKNRALDLAENALGRGGIVSGGVTRVVDNIAVGEVVSPYVWRADLANNELILSGYAPSDETIHEQVEYAESKTWKSSKNKLELGVGIEDEARWLDMTLLALEQIDGLEFGSAVLTDTHLLIEGRTDSHDKVEEVALVISNLTSPYSGVSKVLGAHNWAVEKNDDVVKLSGLAPDEESKRAILSSVAAHFDGQVIDEMGIGGDQGWVRTALIAIPQFVKFDSGLLSYSNNAFYVKGRSPESVYSFLSEDMANKGGRFGIQYDVDVVAPDLHEIEDIPLNGSGQNLSDVCQDAFALIMDANQIYFETAKSDLSRKSGATLDKLIAVARRCNNVSIKIEGHTDNVGSRDMNIRLSNQRAEAVATYLAGRGYPSDRLSAVGFGPDRPASSNNTPEGRAENRRIEFLVSSEETR